MKTNPLIHVIREFAQPLTGHADELDGLLTLVGNARYVLIGEASHGTHDFYEMRAQLTKRLITEKGFSAVAVEGDWPDAYRVNRFARGEGKDREATEALDGFRRFPTWMWRNADVLDFVGWLRDHNDAKSAPDRVGFYGLDLYSLQTSMAAVIAYLEALDPTLARDVRERYACFDHFGGDPHLYSRYAPLDLSGACREDVHRALVQLQSRTVAQLSGEGLTAADERFCAEQNARLVKHAEAYYRTMLDARVSSWNLRDEHMFQSFTALVEHLQDSREAGKVVIWAHNSHVGDAQYTQMGERGEINVGHLFPAPPNRHNPVKPASTAISLQAQRAA